MPLSIKVGRRYRQCKTLLQNYDLRGSFTPKILLILVQMVISFLIVTFIIS